MSNIQEEIARRRTFAIISHPDAGKTTLTEKLLLFGGQIQVAGAVKSNKIKKTATSDWMEIEKQKFLCQCCLSCIRVRNDGKRSSTAYFFLNITHFIICFFLL